jgi:EAL and modified HD-GYP domain-containing signal transduction protein
MLGQWFSRWRSADAGNPGRADTGSARRTPERAAAPASAASTSIARQGSWLVARRPLIDRSGGIAGWDLQLSSRAKERLERRDTPRVLREAYWFALAQAARETADSGRRVLLGLPSDALTDSAFLAQLPARTIVRVDAEQANDLAAADAGWSMRIESRGLLVASPPQPGLALNCAYRLRNAAASSDSSWRPDIGERWILTNLRTYEDVGEAVRSGVEFCCGNFVIAARRPESRQVPPLAANAANILSAIISGRSTREIAEQFKLDTVLSHRLLHATRSAAFALSRPLDSIQEAVMMLGARELYRWLSVLLMSADSRSTLATALHETALTRGRLVELLAQASGRGDPGEQLFVTGTFSLLDLILNVPLEVALALTPLPAPATEALIGESGPWWPYLSIALAIERDESARLEKSCAMLEVDVSKAVELSREARNWAAETVRQLRGTAEKEAAARH